jgi:hypothetical protein
MISNHTSTRTRLAESGLPLLCARAGWILEGIIYMCICEMCVFIQHAYFHIHTTPSHDTYPPLACTVHGFHFQPCEGEWQNEMIFHVQDQPVPPMVWWSGASVWDKYLQVAQRECLRHSYARTTWTCTCCYWAGTAHTHVPSVIGIGQAPLDISTCLPSLESDKRRPPLCPLPSHARAASCLMD